MYAFVSYVRDNQPEVDRLCAALKDSGVEVWLDRERLVPGERWRTAIRRAIEEGFYFIACFSTAYHSRDSTYMNEELVLAIDILRKRSVDKVWFIPVLLSDCPVPDKNIGGGETLRDLQWVSLYQDWGDGIQQLRRALGVAEKEDSGVSALIYRSPGQPSPLEQFAHLDDFDRHLDCLTQIAEVENWNYRYSKTETRYPVLRIYIHNTFARLLEEKKIAFSTNGKGAQVACFNTGLLTSEQLEIFGLFAASDRSDGAVKWSLQGFISEDATALGCFVSLPDVATYFDDPQDLVYDPRLNLIVDYDYIIDNNLHRFPPDLQSDPVSAKALLGIAINRANKRAKRDFRVAIPYLYRNRIRLLLPLDFPGGRSADLALLVGREGNAYRAYTVLPLDMAYAGARVLGRVS